MGQLFTLKTNKLYINFVLYFVKLFRSEPSSRIKYLRVTQLVSQVLSLSLCFVKKALVGIKALNTKRK